MQGRKQMNMIMRDWRYKKGYNPPLESRRRKEQEDLGMKAEEVRLKADAEEQAHLKAEEEAQIAEEARLKSEENKHTRLKVEKDYLLTLEARRQ